jgi:4-amino-4-deoxy-L-arabinose transferase-like glycosyltransferase
MLNQNSYYSSAFSAIRSDNTMAMLLSYLIWFFFLAVGMMVFFYIPWQLFDASIFGIMCTGIAASSIIVWIAVSSHPNRLQETSTIEKQHYYLTLAIIVIGIIFRITWVHLVPPIQSSDSYSYWNAAERLLETGIYSFNKGGNVWYAWRPPGYPFFLAACIAAFGRNPWVPAFTNIVFYILTSVTVNSIARRIANDKVAILAISLLAMWPSHIAITGLAATEPLSILLFAAVLWAFMMCSHRGWYYAAITGMLAGFSALIRPSLLALPIVWMLFIVINRHSRQLILLQTALALISMVLVILPWSMRNYRLFGEFTLISTNGGSIFYRANNPLATGGYTTHGERDLNAYISDEVAHNGMGYAWGMEWIKENPFDFLRLAIRKQAILLGTDATGVYWSLKQGHGETGLTYLVLQAISQVWWIGVWGLTMIGTIRQRHFLINNSIGGLLLLMILLLILIHSVYESGDRYHMPFIGILLVISGLAIYPSKKYIFENEILES